jgi:hypothetical protein
MVRGTGLESRIGVEVGIGVRVEGLGCISV